jgi:hypothetical protein
VRIFRERQHLKRRSGIFVTFDGVSNVTDDNFVHSSKTEVPRVETEEGTVKEARLEQLEKA